MAGQSNMAGGYNEDRIVADSARIQYLLPAGSGPVVPAAEALIAKNSSLKLIVIHCAKSGTFISQWMPGGYIEPCLAQARIAQSAGAVMGGFVFLQGEADAKESGYTYNWAESFTALARYVRGALGTEVPVVICRISHTTLPGFPLWDHVRQEQDSVSLNVSAHVSTDGASLIDGIHYDQASYQMVGQRIADALYGLYLEN